MSLYELLCEVLSGPTYDESAPTEMRAAYIALVVEHHVSGSSEGGDRG